MGSIPYTDACQISWPGLGFLRIARPAMTITNKIKQRFMSEPTAVIADDHPMIRDAIGQLLKAAGVNVVAQAHDGLEAIAQVRAHLPALLTLDIAMPHAHGIDVLVEARRWSPETRILVFSGMNSAGLYRQIVAAQADGVFVKHGAIELLADAIPRILSGEQIIAPEVMEYLDQARDGPDLTLREHQVLSQLAQGFSNKTIAERLGVSAKTIDNHRTNLMRKVGAHSLAELLAHALREGLLDVHKGS